MPVVEVSGDKQRHRNRKRKSLEGGETEEGRMFRPKRSRTHPDSGEDNEHGHLPEKEQHPVSGNGPQGSVSPISSKPARPTGEEIDLPVETTEGKRVKKKCKGKEKAQCKGSDPLRARAALEYLRLWNTDREEWTFKKKLQYWLLQNMYDKVQIPKPDFKVLLRYLDGLRGNQRGATVEQARRLQEGYRSNSQDSGISRRQYKRAKRVLRALS